MYSLDASIGHLHLGWGAWSRHCGSVQVVWCANHSLQVTQIGPLNEVKGLKCASDKHGVIDTHRVKSLDASIGHLHLGWGAWSRHCGSVQVVWCANHSLQVTQIGPLNEVKGLKCASDKHGVIDIHQVKSLDASIGHLHLGWGAWSRHCGSLQVVWCANHSLQVTQFRLP